MVSPAFPTRVMRVHTVLQPNPTGFSPRKLWRREWVVEGTGANSSSVSTPAASETDSTPAPLPQQETSPSSPSPAVPSEQEALFKTIPRPDGGADYVCFCGKILKTEHGFKIHYTKIHRPDFVKKLRKAQRRRSAT